MNREAGVGLCQCGCGMPAPIAKQTITRLGYVKGEPMRFVRGHYGRKIVRPGDRFGRWLVLTPVEPYVSPKGEKLSRLLCRCECGTERIVLAQSLRSGISRSCSCLQREIAAQRKTIHGHGGKWTPTYRSWIAMKGRCHYPANASWQYYGGRGITVCDRWRDSFEAFLADLGERPEGKTLDRIDPDGDYEPGNCRWATPKEQRANQRPVEPQTALAAA